MLLKPLNFLDRLCPAIHQYPFTRKQRSKLGFDNGDLISDPPHARRQVHVPSLNHIGLWVDDIDVAVEDLSAAGEAI